MSQQNPQNDQQALEVVSPDSGIRPSSSSTPGDITKTLRNAMALGHLVSPANSCPDLPPGCAVAVSTVLVDVARETYAVAGGVALHKTALERIAKAVGVSWDPRQSHRTDRGDIPNFASYKAVGHFRDFDGTWRTIEAEKQMDLTEGSERAKTMKPGELSEARKFVAEHAQTKARLRAIRLLGIRSSYTKEELDKPFVCARLIFTGQSDDPEIRKMFAQATAQAMIAGSEMLFGTADTKRPMLTESSGQTLDTGVTSDISAPTGESAAGQGEAAGEQNASAEGAQSSNQPELQHCTAASGCLGLEPGRKHVMTCYGTQVEPDLAPQQSAQEEQPEEEPWVLRQGPAKNLPVNDPKVTAATLIQMEHELAGAIKPNGLVRGTLSEEQIDLFSQELRKIGQELNRRKITEGRLVR